MKNWTRVASTMTAVAIALLVGIGAASSAPPAGAPVVPTPPTTAAHSSAVVPEMPTVKASSSKPPARAETVFVAITPCRILDTRSAHGPFQNGTTRTYYVGGTFGFAPQGGRTGGCGIPVGATAIAANIGSTNSKNNGYLVAWPQNLPRPLASNVNYTKGQTIAGGGIVSIDKSSSLALKVYNFGGPTDVFIDVTGYYAQQIQGMIGPDGSVFSGTDRILFRDSPPDRHLPSHVGH